MPPAGLVCANCAVRGLSERRYLNSPALLCLWVSTVHNGRPILLCSVTSLSETHGRVTA